MNDMHAENAVYHHTCYSNFKANKIPSKYQQPDSKVNQKRGRTKEEVLNNINDEICRLMKDMEKMMSRLLSLT